MLPWDNTKGIMHLNQGPHPASVSGQIVNGKALDFGRAKGVSTEILAPKDGYVIFAKDSTPDDWGGTDCKEVVPAANYIVLGHGQKNPVDGTFEFYTVYLHLKQNSIPDNLFPTGTFGENKVRIHAGQKIGMTGQTGRTTGVHLHFFGLESPPREETTTAEKCGSDDTISTKWIKYSESATKPLGFEEYENIWYPYEINFGGVMRLKDSFMKEDHLGTIYCDPATAKVILYEHVDYGGECYPIYNTVANTNVPDDLGPDGLNVSSIYLNPSYFKNGDPQHVLHVFQMYDGDLFPFTMGLTLTESTPRLGTWDNAIKSLHNSTATPSWLEEKSFAEDLPFDTDIHVVVDDPGDFDAMRVCFNGENCQETSATELNYSWDTYGWADGSVIISIQYRVDSDGGNWANAEKYEEAYSLSPVRKGYAPCSASVDGVELTSGSDCIKVTEDVGDMAPVGWADRSDLQACVYGDDMVVWLYDGVRDQYGNFPGSPHVVTNGNCRSVGGNVSSLDIRSTEELQPVPETPYVADPQTVHLYHFDEGSGSTLGDVKGTLNGSVNSSNWVTGKFGSGLQFPNPTDGRAVTMGTMDVCPMTVEMWVKTSSSTGGRLAGQLGGGGNSGSNKWLLSLDGKKPKFEIWSSGGSLNTTSYRDIEDDGWHHLMATYDCSSKKAILYQDGEIVGEMTSASTWNSGATTFEIGAGEGIYKCNCSIDEVRVSNSVRVPLPPPDWGLLTNGGFETLSSGWATNWTKDAGTVTIDTQANGNEGANALKFAPTSSNAHAFAQKVPVKYQYDYKFTQHVKATSGTGEFGYYVDEYDDEDNWISGKWITSIGGAYDDYYNFSYTPTSADVATASLQYYMQASTTFTVYIDSSAIYEGEALNLVSNPSFESLSSGWANSWTRNNNTAVTIDTGSHGNDGSNSLYLTNHANNHHAFSDYIPVVPGEEYQWSEYVKSASGSGEFGFYIDEYDSGRNWISGHWFDSIAANAEGTYSYTYTPTSGSVSYVGLQYYMTGGTTFSVNVDSVRFSRQ